MNSDICNLWMPQKNQIKTTWILSAFLGVWQGLKVGHTFSILACVIEMLLQKWVFFSAIHCPLGQSTWYNILQPLYVGLFFPLEALYIQGAKNPYLHLSEPTVCSRMYSPHRKGALPPRGLVERGGSPWAPLGGWVRMCRRCNQVALRPVAHWSPLVATDGEVLPEKTHKIYIYYIYIYIIIHICMLHTYILHTMYIYNICILRYTVDHSFFGIFHESHSWPVEWKKMLQKWCVSIINLQLAHCLWVVRGDHGCVEHRDANGHCAYTSQASALTTDMLGLAGWKKGVSQLDRRCFIWWVNTTGD